jgi:HSP20 family protein
MATQAHESKTAEQKAKQQAIERSAAPAGAIRPGTYGTGPFSLMRRFSDDMDRLLGSFFGPGFSPGEWTGRQGDLGQATFWPEIEVQHTGSKLVIQADMPGIKKENISVEVRDNDVCISGERRSESEHSEGGYYRSERSYGNFCRTVPLPDGAKPDTASATFDNGVLRIELEAPNGGPSQARRLEVREGNPH